VSCSYRLKASRLTDVQSPKVVGEALQTRLSEATAVENHACLVDACMEVVSRYS
jgi:hypothetical protein